MKLVIHTQYKENYGAHDWDGTGECPQYWKFKGGYTYVVRNLTQQQLDSSLLSTLRPLISTSTNYAEEYITSYHLLEDEEYECEDWDIPVLLYYEDKWKAVIYEDRYTETYDMHPNGEKRNICIQKK